MKRVQQPFQSHAIFEALYDNNVCLERVAKSNGRSLYKRQPAVASLHCASVRCGRFVCRRRQRWLGRNAHEMKRIRGARDLNIAHGLPTSHFLRAGLIAASFAAHVQYAYWPVSARSLWVRPEGLVLRRNQR